jgi:2-desacetyl-2-hydroxyethyl bacteriochlorophyllide A dehydrogenase
VRALLLREPLRIAESDRPEPEAGEGGDEALVRVRSVGICGSDLHAFRGHHPYVTYPRVLGHELGGEVIEVGPNAKGLRAGDRVCVEPILNCGTCYPCRQGRYNCCTDIRVLGIHADGGMAERVRVPVERLHRPPVDLSFEELALCETLSIGVQAVKRSELRAGETALIVGAGPIGLGTLVAARAKGARILVSDPVARNREAAEAMGADLVFDPGAGDLATRIRAVCPDSGAHVVFEAVGSPATIAQTVDLAAPTGRVVVIGVCKEPVPVRIAEWMRKEVELRTTRNSCGAFPTVLELFRTQREAIGRMVTHRFAFEEGPRVFSWLHESRAGAGVIKAVLNLG